MEEGLLTANKKPKSYPKFNPDKRLDICESCPLFVSDTGVCNPGLWMNPNSMETSHKAKAGYVKGCGCLITRKIRQPNSHCHLGRW